MNVFISWSGERSLKVAELLDGWLQCVIQAIEPWASSKDIDRGSLWFSEITDQLKNTSIGIVCLTHSNKNEPWILFEAGALAKGLTSNRVCTLLIDLKPINISDPLAQFNHTMPDREGIWGLVKTLNSALGDNSLKEKILEKVFETYWPQFEKQFNDILDSTSQEEKEIEINKDEVLSELLTVTRSLDKRIRYLENKNKRLNKIGHDIEFIISEKEIKQALKEMIKAGMDKKLILELIENKYGNNVSKSYILNQIEKYRMLRDKNKNEIS